MRIGCFSDATQSHYRVLLNVASILRKSSVSYCALSNIVLARTSLLIIQF